MAVPAKEALDPASRIEKILARQNAEFRRVFYQALSLIKNSRTLEELADLLSAGRFEEALDAISGAGLLLGNASGVALTASASSTAKFLSNAMEVVVSFDQTNDRAVTEMRTNKLRLVREFTADQRTTLRQVMTRNIEEGLNPIAQAREFRASVGLTAKQEASVARYKRLLRTAGTPGDQAMDALQRKLRDKRFDSVVARAVRAGKPLTEEQIDRMVGRYRERYIKYRSEVIARTEAMRAVNQGNIEMYKQAIEGGLLEPEKVVHSWSSASDKRTRDSHRTMNGQKRPFGEAFKSPSGATLRFPGDPLAPGSETIQCRCALATRILS
jgi:hypothetical protein